MAWDPETRAYIQRRVSEGKTKREAIRCLKRHLARRVWRLLKAPPEHAITQAATLTVEATPTRETVAVTAPYFMPCTR